jgi:hypothetical protein
VRVFTYSQTGMAEEVLTARSLADEQFDDRGSSAGVLNL